MKITLSFLFLTLVTVGTSCAQEHFTQVPLNITHWDVPAKSTATFDTVAGRPSIVLNGKITAKNSPFSNGVIAVDVHANSKRSFAGIIFHKKDGTSEEVYLRMHKSLQPDAVQYTPIYNFESCWQLYHDYQANIDMHKTGWNTIKIEVQDERADVYVNDIRVIKIDELKTDNQSGSIGLFSLFDNTFSDFRYINRELNLEPVKREAKKVDVGVIRKWGITQAILYDETNIDIKAFSERPSINVETEDSGLLPISKHIKRMSAGDFEGNPEAFIVASKLINTDRDENRMFSFDYSDKIIVFLNGNKLYQGNNAFRAKGVQYKGNLNINTNVLFLPLIKGENKLQCIVIDRANGWGLIGKLE